MSEGHCLDPEGLSGHESWLEDDPRLRHLRDCARCQALLASYRLFTAAPADLPPERLAEARARLTQARHAWPAPHAARPAMPPPMAWEGSSPFDRLRRWFGGPRYRMALAFAVVLVVAGTAYWTRYSFVAGREPRVLRAQDETPGGFSGLAVTLLAPQRVHERLVLRWHEVPGADAYEVTLFDAAFSPLFHQAVGRDTMLELAVPRRAADDATAPVYWQVIARGSGDLMAESAPTPLGASDVR